MRHDATYLVDMLVAARKIEGFAAGLSRKEFFESSLHQSAILREIQVIGEAAGSISDEYKKARILRSNGDRSWRCETTSYMNISALVWKYCGTP